MWSILEEHLIPDSVLHIPSMFIRLLLHSILSHFQMSLELLEHQVPFTKLLIKGGIRGLLTPVQDQGWGVFHKPPEKVLCPESYGM